MPNSDQGDRRASRKKAKRLPSPSAAANRKAFAEIRRNVAKQQAAKRPSPTGPFASPIGDAAAPIKRAQKQARRQTARAQKQMPRVPLPSLPTLKHPTRAQDKAATSLTAASVRRAVAQAPRGTSGADRSELGNQFLKEARSQTVRGASKRQQDREVLQFVKSLEHQTGHRVKGSHVERVAAGHALRDAALRNVAKASAGRAKTRIGVGPATIMPGALIHAATSPLRRGEGIAAAHFFSKDAPGLAGRAAEDAIGFPQGAVLGGVEIGKAAIDLAHGKTARAKRIVGSLDDGPVGRLVVHGDVVGAAKSLNDHPLYGLMDFTGAGQVLGRTAGAGLRVGGRLGREGNALERAGATRRAAKTTVEGTNQREARSYSKNTIVKAAQVAAEKSQRKRGLDPNVSRPSHVPFKGQGAKMDAAVDEFTAQSEGMRRRGRDDIAQQAKDLRPKGKGRGKLEGDVVFAAVERRLRGPETFEKDLRAERARLQKVYTDEKLSPAARNANRSQVKAIDRVLGNPRALANAKEVFRAADEYTRVSKHVEKDLVAQNLLDKRQALIAKVRPYAIAKMDAKPIPREQLARMSKEERKQSAGLLDKNGDPLTTKQVIAHMEENGVPMPGFVSQRRDQTGARSYFVNWFGGRKTVDAKRRSGQATRQGSYDASYKALTDSLVRAKGTSDAVSTFDKFVNQFGSKAPDGEHYTWDEAQLEAQHRAEAPGGVEWTPIRATPARYSKKQQEAIVKGQGAADGPDIAQYHVSRLEQARTPPTGKAKQARNVVLVPARQVKRFEEHQTSKTLTVDKAFQKGSSLFRGAVLPFSTKWLFGNVAEGILRLGVAGVSPADFWHGGRVMRALHDVDEQAWRELDVRVKGGLLFGSGDRLNVHRAAEDFKGTSLETPAKVGGLVARSPVVKQTLQGIGLMQKGAFGLSRGLERAFQQGVIGKQARRDAEEIYNQWGQLIILQKKVVQEVARGLTETPTQVRYAREADEILGKYGRFSPSTRRVIQTYAPFLPWFLAAGKFVGYTLPVKHPAKSALLVSIEREFGKDWEEQHKDLPPGGLRFNPVRKDGGVVGIARFTPFGAFTEGPQTLADPILPQLSGVIAALNGKSFTGNDLKMADGSTPTDAKRLTLALYSALESTAPGISVARRLREKGRTAFDDSTILKPKTKPGTSYGSSAANRVFNPLRPTYLRAPTSNSTSSAVAPAVSRDPADLINDALDKQGAVQAIPDDVLDKINARLP